ncbi:MAG: hypothetical protein NWQ23_02300 [Yoonia sp.]|uniref:hypothetical protein n=1 Tax=Yoonia sp. TaxID=2212373 RepID=UPI00273FF34E|nr:hypothetical protein [Yoonia sp.]MDP5084223.1 hypothetical protein [Yoonia sp.]
MYSYKAIGLASDFAATIAGLVLFSVGLTGAAGRTLSDTSLVIVLLQPSGYGQNVDMMYWFALMFLGIGLVTLLWTKLLALVSLIFIIGKILVLKFQMLPNVMPNQAALHSYATPSLCFACGKICVLSQSAHCVA